MAPISEKKWRQPRDFKMARKTGDSNLFWIICHVTSHSHQEPKLLKLTEK